MRTKSLITAIMVGALLAACLTPQAAAQQKYAVLISTGQTTADDAMINSEYWYDLLLMYRTLIDRGFTHNNIFVLYGNGTDFASAHPAYQRATYYPALAQITDFATSAANINNIFAWLAAGNAAQGVPQIQPGDFLFFWWMGHGSWDGDDAAGHHLYHAGIATTGETFSDVDFAAAFAQLPACVIKTVYVMTCHSGALLDNIEGVHMAAHTSSRYDQLSHSGDYDVVHADFSYHASCALRQLTPDGAAVASDADGDGRLTIREANVYAHAQTTSSETVVSDYRGIAPKIALADAQPAATVPTQFVYSRDHAEDDATVPSNSGGQVWYEGPDLWVRWLDDGKTDPQNPEFGQANYVYARAHNIGCAPLNATAALSWSEMTAWANPAAWNPIGSVPLNNLAAGETRVISEAWASVPIPGKYCLHTTLDAPGDAANGDGRAYMDNNKVQVNVTVEDTVWGWTKNFHWWIENGLREKTVVNLVIAKPVGIELPRPPKIQLTLPAGLKFERVKGARLRTTRDGSVVDIPARAAVVVQGIPLEPLEKREAVLSVVLPRGMKLGDAVTVRVSEQVDGREVGGIVFRTRAAEQRRVLADSVRRLENFFRVLNKSAPFTEAEKISALCQNAHKLNLEDARAFRPFMRDVTKQEPGLRREFGRLLSANETGAMNKALDALVLASKKGNIAGFVEAQESMMNASRPFFRKRISR
jgi:hypothetical protein